MTVTGDNRATIEDAFRVIEEVKAASLAGKVEGLLSGGFDVGRKRNLSEIIFVGKGKDDQLPYRLGISMDNVKFEDQKADRRPGAWTRCL